MASELERIVCVADALLLGSSPEPQDVARAEEDVTAALSSLSSRVRELAGTTNTEAQDRKETKIDDDTLEDDTVLDDDDDEELAALEARLVARRRRLKELIDGVRDISADVAMWGVKERFHALENGAEVPPSTSPPQR